METLQNIKLTFKCPKQLNELQPCNGDWYCDGCRKIVHDFRGMSEKQILKAFEKNDYKLCGMFENGRIEVQPQPYKWLKWASAAMLFLGLTSCHNVATDKPLIGDTVALSATMGHTVRNDSVSAPADSSKLQKQQ